ncbi:hypothetical protein [Spirosoma gilvum]
MRQTLLLLGIVTLTIIGLFVYCAALIDWVQDYKTGAYANDHIEATLETAAILLYTVGGFFFFRRRLAH